MRFRRIMSVADARVEGDFDEQLASWLVEEYAVESGDTSVGDRLPFYIAAYSAYRLGYVTLATEALGDTPDGGRFTQAASRYRRSLVELARRLG